MMSLLNKLRLAVWGALIALGLIFAVWLRRDARQDALQDEREKDRKNAEDITRRVAADRHKRMQEYSDRGYRD